MASMELEERESGKEERKEERKEGAAASPGLGGWWARRGLSSTHCSAACRLVEPKLSGHARATAACHRRTPGRATCPTCVVWPGTRGAQAYRCVHYCSSCARAAGTQINSTRGAHSSARAPRHTGTKHGTQPHGRPRHGYIYMDMGMYTRRQRGNVQGHNNALNRHCGMQQGVETKLLDQASRSARQGRRMGGGRRTQPCQALIGASAAPSGQTRSDRALSAAAAPAVTAACCSGARAPAPAARRTRGTRSAAAGPPPP